MWSKISNGGHVLHMIYTINTISLVNSLKMLMTKLGNNPQSGFSEDFLRKVND